jgi:dihydrofolate reductase
MRHFRFLTLGKPTIMGRKTQLELAQPLPDRPNIVITRDPNYQADGFTVVHSVEEAVAEAERLGSDEAMVIGGSQIFEAAMPLADTIYLTEIHTQVEGAAFFKHDKNLWQESDRQDFPADEDNEFPYTFVTLHRAV